MISNSQSSDRLAQIAPGDAQRTLSLDIRKRIGDFLLDVSLDAEARIVALVGPSGSGKTLTLRAIAGLLSPDDGSIKAGSRVLFDAKQGINIPARNRDIGYVFQQYALFPHMSVAQNVAYGLHRHGASFRTERVREVLELVGLSEFGQRMPRTLSGGEQQRVALARALAPKPSALLLDEPLSAVDAPLRTRLGEQLRMIGTTLGIPMLLVTHDMSEATRITDRVVHLERGRVVGL